MLTHKQKIQGLTVFLQSKDRCHRQRLSDADKDTKRYKFPAILGETVRSVAKQVIKKLDE
jgi:SRSO17 transposase